MKNIKQIDIIKPMCNKIILNQLEFERREQLINKAKEDRKIAKYHNNQFKKR